jgi:hypothetical protein
MAVQTDVKKVGSMVLKRVDHWVCEMVVKTVD